MDPVIQIGYLSDSNQIWQIMEQCKLWQEKNLMWRRKSFPNQIKIMLGATTKYSRSSHLLTNKHKSLFYWNYEPAKLSNENIVINMATTTKCKPNYMHFPTIGIQTYHSRLICEYLQSDMSWTLSLCASPLYMLLLVNLYTLLVSKGHFSGHTSAQMSKILGLNLQWCILKNLAQVILIYLRLKSWSLRQTQTNSNYLERLLKFLMTAGDPSRLSYMHFKKISCSYVNLIIIHSFS